MNPCKICGNSDNNQTYLAREMMFGTGEEFEYLKCNSCGCLQIKEIPMNLDHYYPQEYNAFDKITVTKDGKLKATLKHIKAKHCLTRNLNPLGFFLKKIYGCDLTEKLSIAKINFDTNILDVGTGNGRRLVTLRREGFKNLTGVDPFIESDITYDSGVKILKMDVLEVNEQYDFIMLNHSFEHMPNPVEIMRHLSSILQPNKYMMIRVPVVDSYAWNKYLENWVAFDPPRHLFIYNQKSMSILAEKCGFNLVHTIYDGSEYQFWGSEQYLSNIPMRSEKSYYENPEKSIFSADQIKKYRKLAKALNAAGEGDAACFYFTKK